MRRAGRRSRLLLLVLTLATLAAACASGAESGEDPAAQPKQEPQTQPAGPVPLGTQPGEQAPDFEVTTTEGEPFQLSAHRGQVVVIDFLAPG